MDWITIVIGLLIIVLGVLLITFYHNLKPNEKGGLTFKLRTAGIGCLIIGIGLILKEIF